MHRALIVLGLVTGCADRDSGLVNHEAAQQSVVSLVQFLDAVSAMDAIAAISALSLTMGADSMIVTDSEYGYGPYGNIDWSSGSPMMGTAEIACDGAECQLSYHYAIYPLSASASGTITRSGDRIAFDLALTSGHSAVTSTRFTVTGSITATDQLLDSALHVAAMGVKDTIVDYDHVRLYGGCPVGGSIHVVNIVNAQQSEGPGYDVEGTASTWAPCQ